MEFYGIKEAINLVGKSESTIKRMVKIVKDKKPKDYYNPAFFKFEKLPTGYTKILINGQYLIDYFNGEIDLSNASTDSSRNSSTNNSTNNSSTESPELYRDLFEVLKSELEVKNQQIQALQERLRESNILALENTRKENPALLDETKKRKWWHF